MTKKQLLQDVDDDLITRSELSFRWHCHVETIKRREKSGQLHPVRFSQRMVRYRLSEVRAIEREAGVPHPILDRKPTHKLGRASSPSPQKERKGVIVELS
jgi:hypothetical protein